MLEQLKTFAPSDTHYQGGKEGSAKMAQAVNEWVRMIEIYYILWLDRKTPDDCDKAEIVEGSELRFARHTWEYFPDDLSFYEERNSYIVFRRIFGYIISLARKELLTFFVSHLDKIYSAKKHLITHLPKIAGGVHFKDLFLAIRETIEDVEKQMARMEMIYALLDRDTTPGNYGGLSGLVDDAFSDIELHSENPELRDMSILFYLSNIESMEMASFQILQIAAVKLKNEQVKQLIRENYDEAKADRTLMLLIAAKYVTSGSSH